MKEHSLFLAVSFPPKNEDFIAQAKQFNATFNNLLLKAIALSKGVVNISNDAVTPYTLKAETQTAFLTGFPIDTKLTESELKFIKPTLYRESDNLVNEVNALNMNAIKSTEELIKYKNEVLNMVLRCELYTTNYPLLIKHITREAILFAHTLTKLQERIDPTNIIEEALVQQAFWDQIMAEHSEFIRGYLDPTEHVLMKLANDFANKFYNLKSKVNVKTANKQSIEQLTNESIVATREIQAFKTQGTEGILNCKVKSLIVPLLGDHVIREANHYLNLLERIKV
jgi:hypothetical protein